MDKRIYKLDHPCKCGCNTFSLRIVYGPIEESICSECGKRIEWHFWRGIFGNARLIELAILGDYDELEKLTTALPQPQPEKLNFFLHNQNSIFSFE
jgi:hypothetical protein